MTLAPARRIAFAVTVVASLAFTSAAAAASISLSTSGTLAEEQTWQLKASGSSDGAGTIFIKVKPAGTVGCAANYKADTGDTRGPHGRSVNGPFDETGNVTFNDPGNHLVCAWLQKDSNDTQPLATATPLSVNVRANAANVTLSVESPREGEPLTVNATGTTELGRLLALSIVPSTIACAANYRANANDVRYGSKEISGNFTVPLQWSTAQEAGEYRICGYVHESSDDLDPEFRTEIPLTVRETLVCEQARTALSAAEGRKRASSARVAAAKKALKRARGPRKKALAARRLRQARRALVRARASVKAAQVVVNERCS